MLGALSTSRRVAAAGCFLCVVGCGGLSIDEKQRTLTAGEAGGLLPRALLDDAPQFSLPVGDPDLLRAQIGGLALAAERSGYGSTPRLVVPHVSDPSEAHVIRRLGEELAEGRRLAVGIDLTSPRAVMRAADLAEESEVMWVEMQALQAAMFGIPASQNALLEGVAAARERRPGCRIGMRLSGRVSEDMAVGLHGLGFRLFAVGPDELRVARLALGKAGWK